MPNTLPDSLQYQVLATGFDHIEGVCWDSIRKCIWAGGEAGQVYRVELDGTVTIVAIINGGQLLGIALDQAGSLYICDPGNHQVWKMDAHFNLIAFGDAINYPNYPAFAPDGLLYVSDSGKFDQVDGRLFTIDANGETFDVSPRPFEFSNGIAIDDTTVWIVESAAPCVSSMNVAGGPLERTIPLERCVPDGLAFDVHGGLLISCYQPNQLWRWTREEGLKLIFDEWSGELILSPTNMAFYGDSLDRIALASLCGHNLVTVAAPAHGAPIRRP
ncbi:MAG: SMP-30/gluconolactonase/LRE family protein [Acidimicrobiales bacterium]